MTLCREWGLRVSERRVGIDELLQAEAAGRLREVFGCGTAAVITPVGQLGWKDRTLLINGGQPGEMAQRLFKAITDVQYGRTADTRGWITEID